MTLLINLDWFCNFKPSPNELKEKNGILFIILVNLSHGIVFKIELILLIEMKHLKCINILFMNGSNM